jgi:uncharacterized membrane protein
MNTKALSLAGAVAAALAASSFSAEAAMAPKGKEACYGVAMKGHNDCAGAGHQCAGQSTTSYDGKDFKYVPVGSCVKMNAHGHKGSLTPA